MDNVRHMQILMGSYATSFEILTISQLPNLLREYIREGKIYFPKIAVFTLFGNLKLVRRPVGQH
jgi:hypothetical protein